MPHLGDEIAVLDGIDIPNYYATSGVLDASAGANYSGGSSYADGLPLLPSNAGLAGDIPDYYASRNILDASAGANYSGGSSYADGLPLLPSNAGLADDDLMQYGIAAGVLAPKTQVIDASGGANYSGGSSYADGLPLLPSSAGLAGTYEGRALEDMDTYWGSTMGVSDNAYESSNILDASSGANYSGGSSYADGLPLLPSNSGLAGLDAVSDRAFRPMLRSAGLRQAFQKLGAKSALLATKIKIGRLQAMARNPRLSSQKRRLAQMAANKNVQMLTRQRALRAGMLRRMMPAAGIPRLVA